MPKLEEKWPCKRWMTIEPALGMLLPGEVSDYLYNWDLSLLGYENIVLTRRVQHVDVVMTATVDAMTADALNTGREVRMNIYCDSG